MVADAQETKQKILNHFKENDWSIPDVASAMNITEQYLRKILNNPNDHWKQITNIIAKYKIR